MHYTLNVAKQRDGKTYWTRIGTMFKMRDKDGFSLTFDALPTPEMRDGKIEVRVVAFPPREDNREPSKPTAAHDNLDDAVPF